jgi:hypothetical protein
MNHWSPRAGDRYRYFLFFIYFFFPTLNKKWIQSWDSLQNYKFLWTLTSFCSFVNYSNFVFIFCRGLKTKLNKKKHSENREKLHQEHLLGCWGVKWLLLIYVTITTITTATVTTIPIITVTIWVFKEVSQLDFFWCCHNLSFLIFSKYDFFLVLSQFVLLSSVTISFFFFFLILSQLDLLSLVTTWFEYCHNLSF